MIGNSISQLPTYKVAVDYEIPASVYDYKLLMFCPTLSHYQETTAGNPKCSGLVVINTNALGTTVSADNFFNGTSPSMVDVYGGDNTTFGSRGFAFAAQIKGVLSGPEATRSGVMYRGKISFDNLKTSITLEQLIKIATKVKENERTFTLSSAIVNT
jgi:hypothetical protein